MDADGFNSDSNLRASDADRDAAAAVINNAMAEGRLTADEHSERLEAIYAAKTQADLAPLLADLPGQHSMAPVPATSAQLAKSGRRGHIVAIFSGAARKGAWHPDPVIDVVTIFGGVELDFREAVLPGKEITLRVTTVMGGVEIAVPPEMRVIDNSVAILGGHETRGGAGPAGPEAPVLRIDGVVVLGGVEIRRKARKGEKGSMPALGRANTMLEDVLSRALERRHETRHQIREQRREWRDQLRDERRGWRNRTWSDSDQD